MKIFIIGANGMLGHSLFYELKKHYDVIGLVRDSDWDKGLINGLDLKNINKVASLIEKHKPDYVINCVGIIKQLKASKDKIQSIEVNSLWPHQLADICKANNSKMIHFSTDCVFSGRDGMYKEEDLADARDAYGLTKFMGEVDYSHTLTLRTSIIGHELNSNLSLVDWFLSQREECSGYVNAIYSGLPTVVVAEFLEKYVFNNFFTGVYHLSSDPINKFELLKLISSQYEKKIKINPNEDFVIDRSLDSSRLRALTGFAPAKWEDMIKRMHSQYKELGIYNLKETKN